MTRPNAEVGGYPGWLMANMPSIANIDLFIFPPLNSSVRNKGSLSRRPRLRGKSPGVNQEFAPAIRACARGHPLVSDA